jgi:hypothetical protein
MTEEATISRWSLGSIGGYVVVPVDVAAGAAVVAREFFAKAAAEDFSGDLVDEVWTTRALPALGAWFPLDEVKRLGFRTATGGMNRVQILATAGVDKHVDDIHGHVLIWVLHNDGLKFSQGKASHTTRAGEWFIFDDRIAHAVREGRRTTAFVCVSVPLRRV